MSQSSDTDRDPYPPLDFNHPSHAWWLERPVEDLAIQRKLIEETELVILRLLWLTAPDAIDFVSIVKSTEAAFQQSDIMAAKAVQSLEKQGLIEQGPNHIEPEYRLSRKGYERARELRPFKTDADVPASERSNPGVRAGTGRNPAKDLEGVGERCKWMDVRDRAEVYVKTLGGEWPGDNELRRQMACGVSTLNKAIEESRYLRARKSEHKHAQIAKRTPTRLIPEEVSQKTYRDPAEIAMEHLAQEQADVQKREARQYARYRKTSPRSRD